MPATTRRLRYCTSCDTGMRTRAESDPARKHLPHHGGHGLCRRCYESGPERTLAPWRCPACAEMLPTMNAARHIRAKHADDPPLRRSACPGCEAPDQAITDRGMCWKCNYRRWCDERGLRFHG